jgi:DNA polymerase-1
VTLRRDAPFEFALDDGAVDRLDFSALRPIFQELAFGRLLEQLDALTGHNGSPAPQTPPRAPQAVDQPPGANLLQGLEPSQAALSGAERGKYHLVDTPAKLDGLVDQLAAQPSFALDTETTGLNPVASDLVGLSFSWRAGEAHYIPVRAAVGSVLPVELVVSKLKPLLENPSIDKVGQNIKYDVIVLRQAGIEVTGIAFDTMIASALLDPVARSHSLDTMASNLLGYDTIPITDLIGKGRNQITLDQVDTARVCEYAAEDADIAWRLKGVLAARLAGSHVERLFHETEMPLVDVLAEMEHNGIALNTNLLSELGHAMADRLVALQDAVHGAAGHAFNIDSTRQLAVVLFDEQGLEVVKKTKTGRSTDHETLETLASRTENPIPRLVLEYRELSKLKRTYVETLPKMVCPRTGRVHASFDQTGAITGRLSSSDPNLQNIPVRTETGRRIRRAFTAGGPDLVLVGADYSQIELRLLAHFCRDENLVEAFRGGEDVHRTVAAQVNGIPTDAVTPAQRSAAKAVNFGIIYGQSAFGLARSLGISVTDAKRFIDTYFLRYPGIRAFIDDCVAKARETGYAETILGRRRPIQELRSQNRQQVSFGQRIAVNTVVQGSAADLIKRAMIDIHRAYKTGEHSARMLIQVHDELVFEVAQADLEQAAPLIRGKMENAIELGVPVVVDWASGRTWADTK